MKKKKSKNAKRIIVREFVNVPFKEVSKEVDKKEDSSEGEVINHKEFLSEKFLVSSEVSTSKPFKGMTLEASASSADRVLDDLSSLPQNNVANSDTSSKPGRSPDYVNMQDSYAIAGGGRSLAGNNPGRQVVSSGMDSQVMRTNQTIREFSPPSNLSNVSQNDFQRNQINISDWSRKNTEGGFASQSLDQSSDYVMRYDDMMKGPLEQEPDSGGLMRRKLKTN